MDIAKIGSCRLEVNEDGIRVYNDNDYATLNSFKEFDEFDEFNRHLFNQLCTTKSSELIINKIKNVEFNPPYTTIIWKDETYTVVKTSADDVFDPEMGFCAAVTKKMMGSRTAYQKIVNNAYAKYEKKSKKTKKLLPEANSTFKQSLEILKNAAQATDKTARQVALYKEIEDLI